MCTGLATTAGLNTKAIEIENKIPYFTNPATRATLNTKATMAKSGIPVITMLATKVVLNTKVTEIENKIPDKTGFIDTPEFSRLANINLNARMKEPEKILVTKSNRRH